MAGGATGPGEPPGFITKILIPRQRPDVVARPRLVDALIEHLDRRLLLVCAPAGYGKTTLLVEFAHQVDLPVCWYSLGPSDGDPRVFLEYLVAAVQRRFPDFGERTSQYLKSVGASELEATVGLLVTDLHETIGEPFVIVLDDVQTVDHQPAIQRLLDLLIAGLPAGCCCILASRIIPHVRLSRLVANREVAGVGTSDLRFTAGEIKQLFSRHYNLLIPDAQAEALVTEFDGWIAAMILTSHSLWQGLFEGIIKAKRSNGPVFDYLAQEVFERLEPTVQSFLLGSSVLDRLNAERCDRLLERHDSAEQLSRLEERQLLLSRLEGAESWYRYHSLFQEFLQARFRAADRDEFARLHRRAAEMAEGEGDVDAALDHHLQAGDVDRAADVAERVATGAMDAGRPQTLLRWCARLPAEVAAGRPELQIARARAAFEVGDVEQMEQALGAAWTASSRFDQHRLMASVLIWRSVPERAQGRFREAINDCQQGLAMAEGLGDREILALGWKQLGTTFGAAGLVHEAIPALERALEAYAAVGDRYSQGAVCHALAIAWKRRGELARARGLLDQAAGHWRTIGNTGKLAGTLVVYGNLEYECGNADEARRMLAEAYRAGDESGYLPMAGYALATIGDVERDRGAFAAARVAYEQALAIAERASEHFLQVAVHDGLGRGHLYAGNPDLAQASIQRARHLAGQRESSYEQGICEDGYGLVCLESGLLEPATAALEKACELLGTTGAVRELAKARLHLAQARLQAGDQERAVELAHAGLCLLPAGARDPLLAAEGPRLAPLLDAAAAGGPDWLAEVLARLRPAERPTKRQPSVVLLPGPAGPRSIRCYTLGRMDVEIDGRLREAGDWETQKPRELWFYLLAHGPTPRDQIVEALWPDAESERGLNAFHVAGHRLRRTLFPGCIERRGSLWSVTAGPVVWTDDRELERAGSTRRTATALDSEYLGLAARAVELYRGPYLAGLDAEWCERRRRRLAGLYVRLLHDLIDGASAEGQHERAVDYAELYLQTDPDNEAVHEALMRAYVLLGNRPAALRHYQRYAEELRNELEAEPSQRLRLLCEQIARER